MFISEKLLRINSDFTMTEFVDTEKYDTEKFDTEKSDNEEPGESESFLRSTYTSVKEFFHFNYYKSLINPYYYYTLHFLESKWQKFG